MSILLLDETYCKGDLGLLLYKDRKIYKFSAVIENIAEPVTFFGHVTYDIVLKGKPHKSLNYTAKYFCITTRFKELNRLYYQLSTIHRQLYLKDTFPNFVSPKYFGSTKPETIDERRRAIESFLNFVLKTEVLCKTKVFQMFIENAKERKEDVKENIQEENTEKIESTSKVVNNLAPENEAENIQRQAKAWKLV